MSRASNNLRPLMVAPGSPSPGHPRRIFPVTPYPTMTSFTPTPTTASFTPTATNFCPPDQQNYYNPAPYYPHHQPASAPSSPTAGYHSDSSISAHSDPVSPRKPTSPQQLYTRLFTPRLLGIKSTHPSNVSHYDPTTQITHTIWFTPEHSFVDPGTILVHLSGGIKPASTSHPYLTPWYTVHHGADSRWNITSELPTTQRVPTELHSELQGLEQLLGQIDAIVQATAGAVRNVVVVTDSAKLHNGIVYGLEHWEKKDWRRKGGRKSVANRAAWKRVKELIEGFEARGVGVRAWLTQGLAAREGAAVTRIETAGKKMGEAERAERERERREAEWSARQKKGMGGQLEDVMSAMMALKGGMGAAAGGMGNMQGEVVWLPVMVPTLPREARIPPRVSRRA